MLAPALGIAFVAGMIQGLSGFGSALIAVPLLALPMPVETVVPLMALLGVIISAFAMRFDQREYRHLTFALVLATGILRSLGVLR